MQEETGQRLWEAELLRLAKAAADDIENQMECADVFEDVVVEESSRKS